MGKTKEFILNLTKTVIAYYQIDYILCNKKINLRVIFFETKSLNYDNGFILSLQLRNNVHKYWYVSYRVSDLHLYSEYRLVWNQINAACWLILFLNLTSVIFHLFRCSVIEKQEKVKKIQESCLRLMTKNYELSYEELLCLTNEISLHQQFFNSLMTEVYKCLNELHLILWMM